MDFEDPDILRARAAQHDFGNLTSLPDLPVGLENGDHSELASLASLLVAPQAKLSPTHTRRILRDLDNNTYNGMPKQSVKSTQSGKTLRMSLGETWQTPGTQRFKKLDIRPMFDDSLDSVVDGVIEGVDSQSERDLDVSQGVRGLQREPEGNMLLDTLRTRHITHRRSLKSSSTEGGQGSQRDQGEGMVKNRESSSNAFKQVSGSGSMNQDFPLQRSLSRSPGPSMKGSFEKDDQSLRNDEHLATSSERQLDIQLDNTHDLDHTQNNDTLSQNPIHHTPFKDIQQPMNFGTPDSVHLPLPPKPKYKGTPLRRSRHSPPLSSREASPTSISVDALDLASPIPLRTMTISPIHHRANLSDSSAIHGRLQVERANHVLEQTNDALKVMLDQRSKACHEASADCLAYAEALEESKALLQRRDDQLAQLQEKFESLERAHQESQADNQALQDALQQKGNDTEKLQSEMAGRKAEREGEAQRAAQKIEELQTEITRWRAESEVKADALAQLNDKLDQQTSDILSLQDRLEEADLHNKQWRIDKAQFEQFISTLERDLDSKKDLVQRLQKQTIEAAQEQAKDADQAGLIAKLYEEKNQMASQIEAYEQAHLEAMNLMQANSEASRSKRGITYQTPLPKSVLQLRTPGSVGSPLRHEASVMNETTLNALPFLESVRGLRQEKELYEQELDGKLNELRDMHRDYDNVVDELSKARNECADWQTRAEELAAQVSEAQTGRTTYQNQVEHQQRLIEDLQREKAEAQREQPEQDRQAYLDLQQQYKETCAAAQRFRSEIDDLRRDARQLGKQLSQAQKNDNAMQNEHNLELQQRLQEKHEHVLELEDALDRMEILRSTETQKLREAEASQQRVHAGELRVLLLEIRNLKALCERENGFRMDLAYQKEYLVYYQTQQAQCSDDQLWLDISLANKTRTNVARRRWRSSIHAVIAIIRLTHYATKWQGVQRDRALVRRQRYQDV